MRDVAIGVVKLARHFQVVSLGDAPVGFRQGRHALDRAVSKAAVIDVIDLPEPCDRAGPHAGERAVRPSAAGGCRVVVVRCQPDPPEWLNVDQLAAVLFAVIAHGSAGCPVADGELRIPRATLPAELRSFIRRRHVDSGYLAYEGSLILKPEPKRQVHLSSLNVPVVVGRPVHAVRFAVEGAAWGDLLIDVHRESLRDRARIEIHTRLLEVKLVYGRALRNLAVRAVEAQIATDRQELRNVARPDVGAGVDAPRGKLGLSEHVAERIALAPAGRVYMALTAFKARLHGQIRLCVGWQDQEQERREQPTHRQRVRPYSHGA